MVLVFCWAFLQKVENPKRLLEYIKPGKQVRLQKFSEPANILGTAGCLSAKVFESLDAKKIRTLQQAAIFGTFISSLGKLLKRQVGEMIELCTTSLLNVTFLVQRVQIWT
jgi:hypothetical protein